MISRELGLKKKKWKKKGRKVKDTKAIYNQHFLELEKMSSG